MSVSGLTDRSSGTTSCLRFPFAMVEAPGESGGSTGHGEKEREDKRG
jgi:hypothetical protein